MPLNSKICVAEGQGGLSSLRVQLVGTGSDTASKTLHLNARRQVRAQRAAATWAQNPVAKKAWVQHN